MKRCDIETGYIGQCPKCGCEIERVLFRGHTIKKDGKDFIRVPSKYALREVKPKKKKSFWDRFFE